MPLNGKDLHPSTTSGQENSVFQLYLLATDPDPERHLPHSVVDSFKAKPVQIF